jgi:serine protease Do
VILLLASLLAQDGTAGAVAKTLAALRETAGRSVVALEMERDEDPEGRMGRGALAAYTDYYNRPKGPTSGVIYGADGLILTSAWNVSGTIRKGTLRATLWDGRELPATLLGVDERIDIALLKVEGEGLPLLPKAELPALGQGSFVAMIGRSPDKGATTVNLGILSAKDRHRKVSLQTDAEINYGNCGGALVTLRGELAGIAHHVRPEAVWGQSGGVGFACKLAEIDAVLERLKKGERIAAEKRPWAGIQPGDGDAEFQGIEVAMVLPESPAQKAGLKPGDVITHADGRELPDMVAFQEIIDAKKIGDVLDLKVKRREKKNGPAKDVALKLTLEGKVQP